jgi:hypothetical protein
MRGNLGIGYGKITITPIHSTHDYGGFLNSQKEKAKMANSSESIGAESIKKESQVFMALKSLRNEIQQVPPRLDALEDRLAPILKPEEPAKSKGLPREEEQTVLFAAYIMEQVKIVRSIVERFLSIEERIEL